MGNLRSASGWKNWERTTKGERREIRRRKSQNIPQNHQSGLLCHCCNTYGHEKLMQVKRADGHIVPGCAACAKAARETRQAAPLLDTERPTVITPRRPSRRDAETLEMLGLLMRAAFTRSGDLLALPSGRMPTMNDQFRPVRLQLARMCGPRPRYIPSGPVIALGPGDDSNMPTRPGPSDSPSPASAIAFKLIETHPQRQPDEFCASHSGGGGFIRFEGEYRPWSWIRRNCVCAHCGARVSLRQSKVQCYGHYRNARYFQCDGAQRHLFEREADLAWRDSHTERDEALREWEERAVRKAFHWIYEPSDTSDVTW